MWRPAGVWERIPPEVTRNLKLSVVLKGLAKLAQFRCRHAKIGPDGLPRVDDALNTGNDGIRLCFFDAKIRRD